MMPQLNLDPFKGMKPKQPELVEAVEVPADGLVEAAYEDFKAVCLAMLDARYLEAAVDSSELVRAKAVLEPVQLNLLLMMMNYRQMDSAYVSRHNISLSGMYLSRLVQLSYEAGNNDFELQTDDHEINFIGFKLEGTENRPLVIDISGDTGFGSGQYAKYSRLCFRGNAGISCGLRSKYSKFFLLDDVSSCLGWDTEYSEFFFHNNTSYVLGFGSKHSRFNTYEAEAYSQIRNSFMEMRKKGANTIALLDKHGKELRSETI